LDTGALHHLLALVNEFREPLNVFIHAGEVTANGSWFPGEADSERAERLRTLIQGAVAGLDDLSQTIRDEMTLATMIGIQEQAEASKREASARAEASKREASTQATAIALQRESAERQKLSDEHFQRQLEKMAALLLVPTLVASVFGANTAVPGGGAWIGFEVMIALMVLSAVAAFIYLRRLHPPKSRPHAHSRRSRDRALLMAETRPPSTKEGSDTQRLMTC
jgi:hypothetical protein